MEILVIIVGETEHESLGGHCLMESCIKYNDLRNVFRNNLFAGSQSKSMSVVVYGSKFTELVDLVDDLISNEN